MHRTPVNPWEWSLPYSFNQGEVLEGPTRFLVCSGQTAIDGDGKPQHAGDVAAQMTLALDNLDAVLKAGGMTLSNVVRLSIYTTDVDGVLGNWELFANRVGSAGIKPPQTLLGVNRLAFPELIVEIEALAAA